MQVIIAVLAIATVASAGVVAPIASTIIARAPAFDSAVIKSDRLGGNFAYSVAENHAYAAHTPIVQHVTSPVAVSYTAGAPVVTGYSAPAIAVAHAAPYARYAHHATPIAFGSSVLQAW